MPMSDDLLVLGGGEENPQRLYKLPEPPVGSLEALEFLKQGDGRLPVQGGRVPGPEHDNAPAILLEQLGG